MQRKIAGAFDNTFSRLVPGAVGLLQLALDAGQLSPCAR